MVLSLRCKFTLTSKRWSIAAIAAISKIINAIVVAYNPERCMLQEINNSEMMVCHSYVILVLPPLQVVWGPQYSKILLDIPLLINCELPWTKDPDT